MRDTFADPPEPFPMKGNAPHWVQIGGAGDAAQIRALLVAAGLPTEDLSEPADLDFLVVRDDALQVIGAIGLERYGAVGLLRSLVVAEACRNRGMGRSLVATLEHWAPSRGVQLLVLLTETAEPLFTALGYAVLDRRYAPDEIKDSAEFRSLCPASAVCMAKALTQSR